MTSSILPSFYLNKMRGCLTDVNTAHQIIANVAYVVAPDFSAYHMSGRQIIQSFGQEKPNSIYPVPLSYFKIGELKNMDHNKKAVGIA